MGGNSFLLKGWSISLVTGITGFAVTANNEKDKASLLLVAMALIIVFWLVDSYYLSQERSYRDLYKKTASKTEEEVDFSMDATEFCTESKNSWFESAYSKPFLAFYAPAFIILTFVCSQIIGINIYLK